MTLNHVYRVFMFLALLFPFVALRGTAGPILQKAANGSSRADRVTFTSFRPGNWDIYLFTQQDRSARRLTTNPNFDYDARVSPDGRWLVFCSERRGNPDLYVFWICGTPSVSRGS